MWLSPLKLLTLFLSSVLLLQAGIPEKALQIPNGAAIKLKLKCGETHEVRLVRVEKDSIIVQPLQGGEEKPVAFSEIQKLGAIQQHIHPGWGVLATFGLLYGFAGLIYLFHR